MFINRNTNFSFLANQNSDDDLTPQVVRVIKERNVDGTTNDVLVLKFFCRVDRELTNKSNCQRIDLRLSKYDLSYYRSTAKLTQTKVAISKIKANRQEEKEKSDSGPVKDFLKNRQEKRKDRQKKRRNRREERKNRRRNTTANAKRGVRSLFNRTQKDSGEKQSRRRGDFTNRDRKSKREKTSFGEKFLARQGRTTRVKTALSSKMVLEPKNLLLTAKSSPQFRLVKNQDVFAKARYVSAINFEDYNLKNNATLNNKNIRISNVATGGVNNSIRKKRMLEPNTILQISKASYTNASRYRSLYRRQQNSLRTFQKQYLNMIESSIDPIFLFEDSFGKMSFNQSRKGVMQKVSSNTQRKRILPVVQEIQRQIAETSSSRYNFKKIKNPSRYKILECFGRISLSDLQTFGNNAYILFIAKDKDGINLQSQSFSFRINDILSQIIRQSTHVKCSVSRNPKGVAKLNISNLESSHPADVNIEVKKIKRQDNFIETDFNQILGKYQIPGKSSLIMVDGSINTNRRTPVKFKASENLFFRTTINYRGKKYFNANSSAIKGIKGSKKNDNIPNLNIVARIDDTGRGMIVDIDGISPNVSAVKLKKYRYSGASKGKILDTLNEQRQVNDYRHINTEDSDTSAAKSIRFVDSEVFEDRVYMYVAECIMKNGEKKLASDYFIEKFENRTQTVLISDIELTAPNFVADAAEAVGSDNKVTRRVRIDFKISKIENEVDKIIRNMFGNLFDIFESELTKIKDVQGLVYSIEVQRIEQKTGDAVTVSKITADQEGNCVFIDDSAPAFSDVIYKLIPRVRPANEVISAVISQTPFLAKKTISQPVNFVSAAARINAKNRNDGVFTAKKDKFNDRQVFKRGRIRPPKNILQQNSEDLFADASTGDIYYVTVDGLSSSKFFDTIEVQDGFITEIKHSIDPTSEANSHSSLKKKYYELEFETNNDFLVDFYGVFIKEGENIYLDGALHSEDAFRAAKQYSYLVEHVGSVGVIEYYIVPILKTGKILSPKLVAAQLIE